MGFFLWRWLCEVLKKPTKAILFAVYRAVTIYQRDEDGNIVYIEVDGERIPVILGEVAGYSEPKEFYANIAMSGGEAEAREYGMNISDYEAVIVTTQMDLPLTETSIIWWDSEPQYNSDGTVDGDSACYSVLAVKPSLSSMKYLLKKLPKGGK